METKEQLHKLVLEKGISNEEFDQVWSENTEKGKDLGITSVKDLDDYVLGNTRRFYRKIIAIPTESFVDCIFLGKSKLTNWASIARSTFKKNNPQADQKDAVYQKGFNKGSPASKIVIVGGKEVETFQDYAQDFYFAKDNELLKFTAKGSDTNKLGEKLELGGKYNFRAVIGTTREGKIAYYPRKGLTDFRRVGDTKEDIKKYLKVVPIFDAISSAETLPELFLLDITVVTISKVGYQDSVMVEDDSIVNDLSINYTINFEKDLFRVPENSKALLVVRPSFMNGKITGFDGLAFHSDDAVVPEQIDEKEFV